MSDLACLSCGACCAAFRVDFHCSDLASADAPGVPVELTVPLTATLVRMRGTDEAPPRCVALAGEIGREVGCTIYPQRPSPCHELQPGEERCLRARAAHGLPALSGKMALT